LSEFRLWALLIGVDCYMRNELPDGSWYPSLGGCVRDISHIEAFLRTRLNLTDERILKLTATYAGTIPPSQDHNFQPPEAREQWPTYENMVTAFKRVTKLAQAGDQVYIHYSGHGGRSSTAYPDLKKTQVYDEALVPTDIGTSEARYLRDIELAHLLKAMVDKGQIVTVVLDSCHSGGATRGAGGAVARGIGAVDTGPRRTDSLVASHEELAATWLSATAGGTRDVKAGSGWLLEPQGYTLLAACRAQESAYEYPFDRVERNGALTYWLLDSLKQLGPGLSYKMVHDRILAKVHGQFENQTPQLQGEGSRPIFGSGSVQPQYAVPVMQIDPANARVLLGVGQAQPVRQGAQFVIYPPDTNITEIDKRLALVELEDLGATDSWAKITSKLRSDLIEQGAQAVLIDPGTLQLQRPVRLAKRTDLPASIDQQAALARVQAAITQTESKFARLAIEGEPVAFQVAINEHAEYEIWDAAGHAIGNLRPALKITDDNAPAAIAQRLIHLAKYRNVQELDNHDAMSPLAHKLVVELVGKQVDYDPADPGEPQPFDDPGQTPVLAPGEWVLVRIKNVLPKVPGAPASTNVLNITVLDLQPDWGITQIFPSGQGAYFEPLDPEQEIPLWLQASLPAGADDITDITDTIKVFATVGTTNFRWLELPPLDQPIPKGVVTRGAPTDPLEQLLARVVEYEPETRNLVPAAYPSKQWVTAQVEVHVTKSAPELIAAHPSAAPNPQSAPVAAAPPADVPPQTPIVTGAPNPTPISSQIDSQPTVTATGGAPMTQNTNTTPPAPVSVQIDSQPTVTATGGAPMTQNTNTTPAPQPGDKRGSGWTPEQVMQVLKELVTAALGLLLVGYTLVLANNAYDFVGDSQKMGDAKDVLLIMQGLAGVVIGYYFGRVPADARATQAQAQATTATAQAAQAQQQATTATAQAEQVSAQAEQAANNVERIMARAAAPADGAARGAGSAMPADVVAELQRVRDDLREMSRMAR